MTPGSDSEYDPEDDHVDNAPHRGDQEAGPSTSPVAAWKSFPKAAYASVEYPSTVSQPAALLRLVSQEDINEVFNAPLSEQKSLEIRYGNMERNGIPVRGARVPSQKLLLKITRRRRRRRHEAMEEARNDGEGSEKGKEKPRKGAEEGIFTSEVVGPISQTVRFRAMTDFHYTPDPRGRVSGVLDFLRETDYDAILDYVVPPSEEVLLEETTPPPDAGPDWRPEVRSTLDLQPLPIFSERRLPLVYNYKNHSATAVEEYVDERTGEVKKRYINRMRFVTFALQKVSHKQALGEVPKGPPRSLKDKTDKLDQDLLAKMRNLLAHRPVWQRRPFLLQLNEHERRLVEVHKYYLPSVVYTFGAGPFWKTIVRYGYDPRTDPEAYKWQRIYFYLNVNRPGPRAAALEGPDSDDEAEDGGKDERKWEEQQMELAAQGKRPRLDESKEYVFDGKAIHRSKPDYQLCDIHDQLIRRYIDDPANRTSTCDSREGWFTRPALDLIKAMTRVKFEYIKKTNEEAPDSLCYGMIEEFERNRGQGDFEREDSEELREIAPDERAGLEDVEMAGN